MNTHSHTTSRHLLPVICLALMLVVAGVAGLNNALPELAEAVGATQSQQQWIVDGYALTFAALLLPAGALGDRYGRRGILVAGLALFGVLAGLAALLDSAEALIVVRALMGVAAAMIMPATLSIITTAFGPEERPKAIAIWAGVAGSAGILGLLSSGLLLEWFSWPSVFVLNVVLAVAALAGALAVVPSSREPDAPPLDRGGTVLSVAGLAALVFGIIEGPEQGWTAAITLGSLGAGVALLVAFVLWELRTPRPLLDPRLFRRPAFAAGTLSVTVQFFVAFGLFFLVMQYLQLVRGHSPLEAALTMLPAGMVMVPLARATPAIVARFGRRAVGATGLLTMAVGFLVMSTVGTAGSLLVFVLGLMLFGAGQALAATPATTAIVQSLGRDKQGVASAVNDTTRELGGALGIAVLGSVLNAGYRDGVEATAAALPAEAGERVSEGLAAAQAVGARMGGGGQGLLDSAQQAFASGFGTALTVAAAILVAGAGFVAWRAPRLAEERAEEPAADEREPVPA